MKNDPLYISVKSVAEEFCVTEATVYGWIKRGELEAVSEKVNDRQKHKILRRSLVEFRHDSKLARQARLRIRRMERDMRARRAVKP